MNHPPQARRAPRPTDAQPDITGRLRAVRLLRGAGRLLHSAGLVLAGAVLYGMAEAGGKLPLGPSLALITVAAVSLPAALAANTIDQRTRRACAATSARSQHQRPESR